MAHALCFTGLCLKPSELLLDHQVFQFVYFALVSANHNNDGIRKGTFGESAQEVITLALREAEYYNVFSISPEHLLIALLSYKDEDSKQSAFQYIDCESIMNKLRQTLVPGNHQWYGRFLHFDDDFRYVLGQSILVARGQGKHQVSVDHLWIGLLTYKDGFVARVLTNSGVSLSTTRDKLLGN